MTTLAFRQMCREIPATGGIVPCLGVIALARQCPGLGAMSQRERRIEFQRFVDQGPTTRLQAEHQINRVVVEFYRPRRLRRDPLAEAILVHV